MHLGGKAILKSLPLVLLCYVAAAGLAVKMSYAQDAENDYPQTAAEVSAQASVESRDALTIEELDALLPEHLRTPLPVRENFSDKKNASVILENDSPAAEPASRIETFYREITNDKTLTQYGYDFFGRDGTADSASGAVQDDYILGAGDRLNVSFLGERKDRATYVIDRAGSLNIDLMPPIAASGKTLGALRGDLQRLLGAQAYHGEIFLSLERVRQIGVLVAGQVAQPGRKNLTPLQTPVEALESAGGVLKSGSLRQVRVIRRGEAKTIDLYDVMNAGGGNALMPTLQDGDRILVPPLGPTLAITGDVHRPAIYELPAQGTLATNAALNLSGGLLSRGQNRLTLMIPQSDGRRTAQTVQTGSTMPLGDGAILDVTRTLDRPAASFMLSGETRSPGTYPLAQYGKLSKILHAPESFGDDVYPLLGIVSRKRAQDLARDLIAFSPQDVFMGRSDMPLQDGDSIKLLSRDDVRDAIKKKEARLPDLMITFIREHAVSLQGAVRLPGNWPVAGPVAVEKLLDVAGGALSDADLTRVEINRNDVGFIEASAGAASHRDVINLSDVISENVTVTFGDAIRIPDRFETVTRQSVEVHGEVRNPGTYDLMRGDTLLTLIDRAGGLTDQAYPLGTVFSRAAERRREKEKFASAARDLERAIAMASDNEDGKVDMQQIALAKELADELKTIEPVGRVTVESDPGILRGDPNQDILLEAGDKVYIPKRPLSVRVTGEVLSPAALQFRSDKKTSDYIAEAGGMTQHADSGRMFILYPNGSAQPIKGVSWTKMKPLMVTPGSTIVVPRDPKPFDFMESAKDITQILSNLAITGLYADELIERSGD